MLFCTEFIELRLKIAEFRGDENRYFVLAQILTLVAVRQVEDQNLVCDHILPICIRLLEQLFSRQRPVAVQVFRLQILFRLFYGLLPHPLLFFGEAIPSD